MTMLLRQHAVSSGPIEADMATLWTTLLGRQCSHSICPQLQNCCYLKWLAKKMVHRLATCISWIVFWVELAIMYALRPTID